MANVTQDITATVDIYISMWNEADAARRARQIEQTWVEGGLYMDPLHEDEGYDGLSEMVEALHAVYPGYRFRRSIGIESHHHSVRFGWEFLRPDGSLHVGGSDIGTVAPDGRLHSIVGFFGDPPALES